MSKVDLFIVELFYKLVIVLFVFVTLCQEHKIHMSEVYSNILLVVYVGDWALFLSIPVLNLG